MSETHLRLPRRVRHELKFRRARVEAVEQLTPALKRIVLSGEELEGFFSPGFDDHVKIFPALRGQAVVLPTIGPNGPVFAEPKPTARDYTPRAFDAANRRLTIDFAVGHGGPATAWAEDAQVGVELLAVGVDDDRAGFLGHFQRQTRLARGGGAGDQGEAGRFGQRNRLANRTRGR